LNYSAAGASNGGSAGSSTGAISGNGELSSAYALTDKKIDPNVNSADNTKNAFFILPPKLSYGYSLFLKVIVKLLLRVLSLSTQ
jgi:hypothetical protein